MEKRKVTIYIEGMFGFSHVEASACEVEVRPYAQYPRAVHLTFIPKGARKPRGTVKYPHGDRTGAGVVMLEGWGHPENLVEVFRRVDENGGITRYLSCDPRWATEFNEAFDAYVAKTGATVIADYRKEV